MNEQPAEKSPWIIDTTDATFAVDVIERSRELPVVVDFWASWCQPCRMLGPLLEQLAREYDGKFLLVKADTEQTPAAASQFNVQSIPAVFGLRDGEVVDFFAGLLPEEQLRSWLDRLQPSPAEVLCQEAGELASSDAPAAEAKYREAIMLEPKESPAKIGLAQLLFDLNRLDEAGRLIQDLEQRGFLEPAAEKIRAALEIQSHAQQAGSVDECQAAAMAEPDNLTLQLKLAEALAADKQYEPALIGCLAIVKADRRGVGEQAKQVMVDIFRLLPEDSELTSTYRRQLSMALY